jgi:hypothetical protein
MPDTAPFFEALRLQPHWEAVADAFARQYFSRRYVVGVHVRHGNGEPGHFKHASRQIKDLRLFTSNFERYLRACHPRVDPVIFVSTDSDVVIDALADRFPGQVVSRRQWRPAADAGCALHLAHEHPAGRHAHAADAAIDMMLLRRCDIPLALVPASTRRLNWNTHVGLSGFPVIANQANENFQILIVEDEFKLWGRWLARRPRYREFDDAPVSLPG